MRGRVCGDAIRRARAQQFAAGVTAFGAEVDDPVGGTDHVEVVFDDNQRVAGGDQLAERAQQFAHIIEMQPRGRFVKQEQYVLASGRITSNICRIGEVAGELQPLRFAAR